MSNKTQLQTNNTELTNLITALQGKAVGGGSVETCMVTVTGCKDVFYTSVESGAIVSQSSRKTSWDSEHTIQVIKNSSVFCGNMRYSYVSTSTGAELIGNNSSTYSAWKITSDNAIIYFANGGGSG